MFEHVYESSFLWAAGLCKNGILNRKIWSIGNGEVHSSVWNTGYIPKAGLSIIMRERENDSFYRVGLNIYPLNPLIPDGSLSILFFRHDNISLLGGVIELFPAVRIEDDVEQFKQRMDSVAMHYHQDAEALRQGPGGAGALSSAEAGFNFYRAGLEPTPRNFDFVKEAYHNALDQYKIIVDKRTFECEVSVTDEKESCWRNHLKFMVQEDMGLKIALDQDVPPDFFTFTSFPPAANDTYRVLL